MNEPAPKQEIPFPESAFPTNESNYKAMWSDSGMTLRDWFAGHAPLNMDEVATHKAVHDGLRTPLTNKERFAVISALNYAYADAMLAARAKTPTTL